MDQVLLQVEALNEKLDALAQQVALLTEQAQIVERERQARVELTRDLIPIANDGLRIVVEQLEEVQEYVELGELLRIAKRLLRNGRHFEVLLDQLESLTDLAQTVGPLADQAFEQATELLQRAEQKGYFALARSGMQMADRVIASVTPADVARVTDGVAPMLGVVRRLTQPEVMGALRDLVSEAEAEIAKPVASTSLLALLGQMRDPEVRRGLVLMLRILRAVGARAAVA